MINKHSLYLLFILLFMAACSPRQEPTAEPTPSATPTAAPSVPTAPTSIVTVDDAALSRLRLASLVAGGPNTDFYVDGAIARLGSDRRELTNVPAGFIPGFLYLAPGEHSVAIVPSGEALDAALIALDLTLEAGHRYTVAVVGQADDDSFTPLVIDETAAVQGARTAPQQNIMILVNNLHGADTIDFLEDGAGPTHVPYGGFVAAPIKEGRVEHIRATANGSDVLEEWGPLEELPGIDFIHSYNYSLSGKIDFMNFVFDSGFSSDLNAHDLLELFTDHAVNTLSFSMFLAAVEAAGLDELLTSGPYMILAPTDTAFGALPPGQFDALMADREALKAYLLNYFVEGYYPYGALSGSTYGTANRTFTNMQGMEIKLMGDLVVNGVRMDGLPGPTVAHGTRILPLSSLFLPPSQ